MQKTRKLGSAVALAALIASGMMLGTTRLEAKGRKGGDPNEAICAYLASVINYPYVTQTIRNYALSLFNHYNCDPSLIN